MSNFDITTAPMPWVKPRENTQEQNVDINLENIDTLYSTTLSEGQRTTFDETFETINDLTHPSEGYFVDEETGASGFDLKEKEEKKIEDNAKYFYMGLVTGGSLEDVEKFVNEENQLEYALENDKNKNFICKNLEISEEEYDALACVALALASQETGMGFEVGDSLKDPGYEKENANWFHKTIRNAGIKGKNLLERLSGGSITAESASSGLTQLKIYDHMQSTEFISNWYTRYLEELGIEATNSTEDNLYENPDLAASATMITLVSLLKHHSSYKATMKVYHENLEEELQNKYAALPSDALEKGYNHIIDIYEEYQNMDDDEKKEVRFAMKHWLLSADGSTKEKKSEDGDDYTEEIQLENLNSHLPEDKQMTQEDLDYIRYFLTDENMTMSAYEYLPYAWNKGTEDKPDRVMADQMGLILSDPEIYDYDQHTANVVAIAEKYAQQATGSDGYWALNDVLENYKKPRWYN